MCMAILIAFFFIIDPKKVVRDDGTHIAIFKDPNVMEEVRGIIRLFTDWRILMLIPGIFVAEMNLVSAASSKFQLTDLIAYRRCFLASMPTIST